MYNWWIWNIYWSYACRFIIQKGFSHVELVERASCSRQDINSNRCSYLVVISGMYGEVDSMFCSNKSVLCYEWIFWEISVRIHWIERGEGICMKRVAKWVHYKKKEWRENWKKRGWKDEIKTYVFKCMYTYGFNTHVCRPT